MEAQIAEVKMYSKSSKLDENLLMEFLDGFLIYSKGTQFIHYNEIKSLTEWLGHSVEDYQIEEIFLSKHLDRQRVDIGTFLKYMDAFVVDDFPTTLFEVFKIFDRTKDGYISKEEMQFIYQTIGADFSVQDLDRLFSKADTDGSGYIDFDEFKKMVMNN